MEDTFLLSPYGKQLWTRQTAQGVRADLYAALARLASGDTLVINVRGVEVFDFSFANEFFGKSVRQRSRIIISGGVLAHLCRAHMVCNLGRIRPKCEHA